MLFLGLDPRRRQTLQPPLVQERLAVREEGGLRHAGREQEHGLGRLVAGGDASGLGVGPGGDGQGEQSGQRRQTAAPDRALELEPGRHRAVFFLTGWTHAGVVRLALADRGSHLPHYFKDWQDWRD
ncbi:hypothetical protein [Streptomyces sp. UH6]|uniref:hypothetical protein n=1 Tax=Streptomyces sp. UH6 TaxID=2748379 RepID=UPI0015D5182C|nr:hypothetical protein [Streptomyces sp. UH6]NYV73118.1 hypothetical protein [Streptomyces sp. UH6]